MHTYHQVFLMVGVIDVVALVLTIYIVYVLLKLNRLVGSKGLLLVLAGYLVFSLGLGLSIASSILVFFYGSSGHHDPPEPIIRAHRGLFSGEDLAFRVGFIAWSIIGYSSIVYAASYLLILVGLLASRYRVKETNPNTSGENNYALLVAVSAPVTVLGVARPILHASYLLLVGDGFSIILLVSIILLHCGYLRGLLGYILLLVSHIFRLLAVFLASPWTLIVAELVRPLGLILIATALAGASRK